MAVRKSAPVINNIPYEEFNDNETLEKLIDELNAGGVNAMVAPLDKLIDWGRSNSLWPLTFATSCCGIEFMAVAAARYDMARFGFEITRNSPRQGDVLLVNGTITTKMAPVVKRLYDQMCDQIRHCRRRMRHQRRSLHQELPRSKGSGQDSPRRRLLPRLPSTA